MLSNTLDSLEEYTSNERSITDEMKDAYLLGGLKNLQDLSFSDYDENDPIDVKIKNRLITDNPDTQYFFTIGAGHYYGDEELIALLEEEGFTITRVEFDKCEECDNGEVWIEERCYVPYSK